MNRLRIIFMIGLILGMTLMVIGCSKAPKQSTFPFITVKKGYSSGYQSLGNLIINDQATWTKVWDIHSAGRIPRPALPQIDFTQEMLIAVFRGTCPTGGYATEITRIERREDKIMVNIVETNPGPESVVTQALTQPYHIVKIERSVLPIEFAHQRGEE